MTPTKRSSLSAQSPIILALETATFCGSVALVAGDRCIAEHSLQTGLTHSRSLHVGIDRLMKDTALEWADIDSIAVSSGPGSFTGLRIGMSTAKGLAMAAKKPLLGVPTLDGLANQLGFTSHLICPVLDARKKQVFAAFYRCPDRGRPQRLGEYMVLEPARLVRMIKEPVILIGDGVERYQAIFQNPERPIMIPPAGIYFPRAACIGVLAVELWAKEEFLDLASAVPIYIRPSDAEINFPEGNPGLKTLVQTPSQS